ncbi:MAG: aminotransferase class I/II-fold pyridoxal phosphate-dependent enzyme [Ruthenibacterium sp.]
MVPISTLPKEELLQKLAFLQKTYDGYAARGLKLDMSRGKPSPDQLDLSMDLLTITAYKGETGIDSRNYGNLEGMPEARKFFADMLGVKPEETFVGGNSSLNMMYYLVDLGWRIGFVDSAKPWREDEKPKFLCPAPGYDRHFRVTEYFGFDLLTVPMTPDGPDMDIVEELVKDAGVKGIWSVPMYSNPDGYTYSDETVRRLAKMETAAPDFKIFWDNAYCVHHLTDTPASLLNILDECRAAGHANRAMLFCSLSKVTFPGAGVAAMAANKEAIDYILKNMFSMIISFDKLNQMRHVTFLKDQDGLAAHMKKHRALVAPKFELVQHTFETELADVSDVTHWTNPQGGYFISLYVMPGCAKRTVQLCKEAGVVLTGAGAAYPYGIDPQDTNIRIAPTYPPIGELDTASQLLCVCLKIATIEKLLQAE